MTGSYFVFHGDRDGAAGEDCWCIAVITEFLLGPSADASRQLGNYLFRNHTLATKANQRTRVRL